MNDIINIIVTMSDHGLRLDKLLAKHVPSLSRSHLQSLISDGAVEIEGHKSVKANYKTQLDDVIILKVPEAKETHIKPTNIPLNIVFEDDQLLVINKQAGLTTHPGAGNYDNTLVNGLLHYLGNNLSSIGGILRPGIVHRLDKDTSGLMLVAKTNQAHQALSDAIANRDVKRIYHAFCIGTPIPTAHTIDAPIGRHRTMRLKMTVTSTGKEARTHYRTLERFLDGKASLVQCQLESGRTHQIRVHMSHIKHPLIGDSLYLGGIKQPTTFPRQALHSKYIGFHHPITEAWIEFESDYPEDLQNLYDKMKFV